MKRSLIAIIMAAAMILVFAFTMTACSKDEKKDKKLTMEEVAGTYALKKMDGKTPKEYMVSSTADSGVTEDQLQMVYLALGCTEEEFYNDFLNVTLNADGTVEYSGKLVDFMKLMNQEVPSDASWKVEDGKIVTGKGAELTYENGEISGDFEGHTAVYVKK